jgi:Fic family protein
MISNNDLISFLKESNSIEGEDWNNLPMEAAHFALSLVDKDITVSDICQIHKLHEDGYIESHAGYLWSGGNEFGVLRKCEVHVGNYYAPSPLKLPDLMSAYCSEWPTMNAWTAHCGFEEIHPFFDLNGRVGRLLWLMKVIKDGEYFRRMSFLQQFYYQTLNNFRK